MSHTATFDHEAHAKAENVKFHHFVNLALFMAAVTGLELLIVYLPFYSWIIYTGVVVLSILKFGGVILWFMHLIYDRPFCTILFMMGLTIAIATVTALLFLFWPQHVDRDVQTMLSPPPAVELVA